MYTKIKKKRKTLNELQTKTALRVLNEYPEEKNTVSEVVKLHVFY
jgi:hypothetical protein